MERNEEGGLKARYWDMYWKMMDGIESKKPEMKGVVDAMKMMKKGAQFLVDNNMDKQL